MGIRGIELDPWYCYDQMRLAHLGTPLKLGCLERHKLFSDGVQEIADFLNKPENVGQIIRIYMNDGKNVVIVFKERSDGTALTHGDVFIHRYNWTNIREYQFTPYPLCGGKTPDTGPWRVYSDSTFYT
ncbi:hypothetical protein HOLleu_25957 [Holothuria leucospilota]|uniref:Uncharacterized protein n=1 Tax=Holothuria leucospilota TaxID=206669 RepID=A0A9Q1BTM0_HOLLE|nr:hypothetical protein HOLleu_25957 [Holothuria leucospilota]